MKAKDILKQQVWIVSEVAMESGHAAQTSKLHKFAKQILRVLASCRLMSFAEGQSDVDETVYNGNSFAGGTLEALGHGLWQLSPISFALCFSMCILLGMFVIFMTPGGRESEPEDGEGFEREPAAEPLTSRYDMNNGSLGNVYAHIISVPMFRVEGMLVWMYHRCEGRVHRN